MNKIMRNIIVFAAALLVAVSCDKEPDYSVVASRFKFTLGSFLDAEGMNATRSWEADDEVAMFCLVDGKEEKLTANPLVEGRREGMFMFNWESYQKGRELAVVYPSDAPVRMVDGEFKVEVPATQDGSFSTLFMANAPSNGSSFLDTPMTLEQYWHTFHVSVAKNDYSIAHAEFISDEQTVKVQFESPLDCSKDSKKFYISLPPMTLNNGYTIVFTTVDGKSFEVKGFGQIVLEKGAMTEVKNAKSPAELVVCGDNMIYIINADIAAAAGFENAVTWSWNAETAASVVGGSMTHLDECKIVDNGTKVLATSSYSWAVLLDIATKEVLWWSKSSKNAHSAELLPDGRIAVACAGSDNGNGDIVQIFDISKPNEVLSTVPLASAHGVVWNAGNERLYAVGGSTLNSYKLTDWSTSAPTLTLDKTVSTSENVSSLHDLSLVNASTLLLAGKKAALYNISTGAFTNLPHFGESTALKSVNYNSLNGVAWYTDATKEEYQRPGLSWATNTIFYTSNVAGKTVDMEIPVPENLNMYKVRVKTW